MAEGAGKGRGRIFFGDEMEALQTEALASRMIEDVATQHGAVGEKVINIKYTAPSWNESVMTVNDLDITFASGLRITAPQAHLDFDRASDALRSALRDENARQAATADQGGAIRAAGETIGNHPGPKLDVSGDPIEPDSQEIESIQAEFDH